MTYKIIYQMGENEMTGFTTIANAIAECSSWGSEQIAMTEDFDGYADAIVNEETGITVCYLADKDAVCLKFDIVSGDSFMSGLMNVGTYSDEELAKLK